MCPIYNQHGSIAQRTGSGHTVCPRSCSLLHSNSRPSRMTSCIHSHTPETTHTVNGTSPHREPPNILPIKRIPIENPTHSPVARFCNSSNMGLNEIAGVGWKRTLVFSPRIGTSDVVPSATGSGGAVTSCASLYSAKFWFVSDFTACDSMPLSIFTNFPL